MKNNKKGFVASLLILVGAILIIGGGIYKYQKHKVQKDISDVTRLKVGDTFGPFTVTELKYQDIKGDPSDYFYIKFKGELTLSGKYYKGDVNEFMGNNNIRFKPFDPELLPAVLFMGEIHSMDQVAFSNITLARKILPAQKVHENYPVTITVRNPAFFSLPKDGSGPVLELVSVASSPSTSSQ